MIKDKPEIITVIDSIARTLQMLNDLPPDIAHYTWDEKRIEIAQSCLLLAAHALKDDNDSKFLRNLVSDLSKEIDGLEALNC
jgi:hypothetical protein